MGIFDIFEGVNEIPHPTLELPDAAVMNPEMRNDVSEFKGQDVVVFGKPFDIGEVLDHVQGDNPFDAHGNCNLVSTSNFLNLCGITEANETMITGYAIVNGECEYSEWYSPESRGISDTQNMQNILSDFGVETEVVHPYDSNGDIESIAARLEEGYVGAMGVNAGMLWGSVAHIGDGDVNHEVTLTGTVRDENGNLLAITVCDSGTGEACHVVPVDKLRDCYENVSNADVVFSVEPIRAI